ncbi:aminotransferase class V [Methylocella silvestris BL2]|uniref:Cysteine desulfurase n=1 Tax=Methylocella silvestris (strain DSM 15510 / CIP 108128 / LMG 27833 / NCIMB 13906 / BL2) TaxID=395965 RepID=B8EI75_METSB|nr:cysteine desulfurase family protein [Methylocella silvestris]ACK50557.1 aminotransferase class V [Methylocella silvestris BL2]
MPPIRAYLDHNATTPLRPAAREAMLAVLDRPGNASSVHAEGRAARALIENARIALGGFINAPPKAIVFASGGTEALNLALTPTLRLGATGPFDMLLVGAGEHAAVLSGHRFAPETVAIATLTPGGVIDLEELGRTLRQNQGRRILLALQAANNETGVIQPVAAAAALAHAAGGALICDAVQAAGKIDCDLARLGADAIVVSAHKFGGPQGAAALCFREETSHIGATMVRGGGQERGFRGGTENVAAIAGMAAALGPAREAVERSDQLASWRDEIETEIARFAPDATVFGQGEERLPNTSCFAIPGVEAQLLLMRLDIEGVAVSSGSACSSGKVKRSHVLTAMRVAPDLARGAIRVSLGWDSTKADCATFVGALENAVRAVKARTLRASGQMA